MDEGRIEVLDGWRGLAIALVLCSHFLPETDWLDMGRLGVNIFFCLSGLLMSNLLFVKRVPLGLFYKRRFSRILPVFLVYVAVVFAGAWLFGGGASWVELIATALFLRTYIPSTVGIWESTLPLGHLWSLNAEEHSYVFLSLVTLPRVFRGREAWVLILTGMVTIAIGLLYVKVPSLEPPSRDLGTEVVTSFLLISSGYALVRHRIAGRVRPWMPVVTLALGVFLHSAAAPWWSRDLVAPFALAFTVNHLSQAAGWLRRLFSLSWLRRLGIWSYSIYIWQQPFYRLGDAIPYALGLPAAIAVSLASFYWFEDPVRRWLNERWA